MDPNNWSQVYTDGNITINTVEYIYFFKFEFHLAY